MDEQDLMNIPNTPFTFSGVAPENLTSPEYTLVAFVCDKSGSVSSYEQDLLKALNTALDACRKSPRSENILVRTITFNQHVDELHGFTELSKVPDYVDLACGGMTALFDATYSGIAAVIAYADKLRKMDYSVNAVIYILTDGEDNSSTYGPSEIKAYIEKTLHKEELGSIVTVLIGINDNNGVANYLDDFKNKAGLTQFISIGDATPGKLAKLGNFISRSISSSSQSLASGSTTIPSASLTF